MGAVSHTNSGANVVLVTGASSGIGKCCAEYLSQQGYRVYGTSRKIGSAAGEQKFSNSFEMIQMDVTDETSVKKGIDYIFESLIAGNFQAN